MVDYASAGSHVSFQITNFPPLIPLGCLRKEFEVCGILSDVYVSDRRNANGAAFGFARFSNVKDILKMLKALNKVFIGE